MARRAIAMVVALLALASFALPFFAVMYKDQPVIHFTGIELLQGTSFHQRLQYGNDAVLPPPLPIVPVAWLAFASILIAGVALLREGRWRNLIGRASALVGIIATIALRARGASAIAGIMPFPLRAVPLPLLWLPVAAAAVLWLASVFHPQTKTPAEAGVSLKLE